MRVYVCMHVCVHAWVCMWVCTHMHARVHVPMYVCACVCLRPCSGGPVALQGRTLRRGSCCGPRAQAPALRPPLLPQGPLLLQTPIPRGTQGRRRRARLRPAPIACAFTPGARGSRRVPCSRRGSFPAALVSGQPGAASDAPCAQMDTGFASAALPVSCCVTRVTIPGPDLLGNS